MWPEWEPEFPYTGIQNNSCAFCFIYDSAPGGNRTPDNPAPETGALSTELQVRNKLTNI